MKTEKLILSHLITLGQLRDANIHPEEMVEVLIDIRDCKIELKSLLTESQILN